MEKLYQLRVFKNDSLSNCDWRYTITHSKYP